jgi:hypothetical protein
MVRFGRPSLRIPQNPLRIHFREENVVWLVCNTIPILGRRFTRGNDFSFKWHRNATLGVLFRKSGGQGRDRGGQEGLLRVTERAKVGVARIWHPIHRSGVSRRHRWASRARTVARRDRSGFRGVPQKTSAGDAGRADGGDGPGRRKAFTLRRTQPNQTNEVDP